MLTLPFILLLQALLSGFNTTSMSNLTLGLFLMALLVSWQRYLVLFAARSIAAQAVGVRATLLSAEHQQSGRTGRG
tara:strand:- start:6217 stop:6444 length:228 start_codon:yes stop_codon:yes gene_type:complete